MPSYDLKPPLRVAHDLPPEGPGGPAPRSPLRVLVAIGAAFVIVLGGLWAIGRSRSEPPSPPRFEVEVRSATCPKSAPAGASCAIGIVQNVDAVSLVPRCEWSVNGVGGALSDDGPLGPSEVVRTRVFTTGRATAPIRLSCSVA